MQVSFKNLIISTLLRIQFFIAGILSWLFIRLGIVKPLAKAMAKLAHNPRLKRSAFKGYTPDKHDIVVCTFGKSGTNWALQIVTQTAWYGEAEFNHIHDIVPWAEAQMLPYIVELDKPTYEQSPAGLRALKTHFESEYVPYAESSKYITVIRDPKDVLLSAWFFIRNLMPVIRDLNIDDFIDMFLEGATIFGSWSRHTAGYWNWRDRPNVLILFYSEMIQDLAESVRRISHHMSVNLTEEQFSKVVYKSGFAYMQEHDKKFAPNIPGLTRNSRKPIMVRAGKTGSARDVLNSEQQNRIDQTIMEQLKNLGSEFPYTALFCGTDTQGPA